jgi:hypothetical protein
VPFIVEDDGLVLLWSFVWTGTPSWRRPAGFALPTHPFEVLAVSLRAIDEACVIVRVVLAADLLTH